jgi:hypothetical protein
MHLAQIMKYKRFPFSLPTPQPPNRPIEPLHLHKFKPPCISTDGYIWSGILHPLHCITDKLWLFNKQQPQFHVCLFFYQQTFYYIIHFPS